MNKINRITSFLAVLALAVGISFGQGTALTATTLSTAVTSTSATTITLASSTGVTAAGSLGQFTTVLYIGKELIGVRSLVSGTTWLVTRGLQATRPLTYPSGYGVLLGPPTGNFLSADYSAEAVPGTTCIAINDATLPRIYLKSGHFYDCVAVAGSQVWILTNDDDRPVLGSAVASAATIAATGNIFHVTGTAAIVTITVPNGTLPGIRLTLIPDAIFTWTAAGNIALAGTAVVNKALIFTWSGSKWVGSY